MKKLLTPPKSDYFHLRLLFAGVWRWLRREPRLFGGAIHRAALENAKVQDAKEQPRKR